MTNPASGAISAPTPNPVTERDLTEPSPASLRHRDNVIAVEDAHRAQQLRTPQSESIVRIPALLLALAFVAAPLQGQSLIFPSFFDKHIPHAFSKPAIAIGITEGLKLVGVPKRWAVVGGLALPLVFGKIRQEIGYPGSIGKTETWKDSLADTFAAATVLIPLNLKGRARWMTFSAGVLVYVPGGMHKWSLP